VILELEWERVDLSADYSLSARLTLYRTKSGKPRGVPLNRAAIEALTALAPKPEQRVGRIFTKRDDRWGQIRTAFTTALTRAGIKVFRFHDVRHTFASHFVMRGGSLRGLQEILGHSDYKMTLRYSHLSPAHLRADVDRLDGLTPLAAAHSRSHSAISDGDGGAVSANLLESKHAPVAQVDRAAVS
jgi:integrase